MVQYKYDAWGNHAALYWNKVNEKEQYSEVDVAAFDENYAHNKTLAELNPFRYRGYYYDTETGLYYLKTRYYDPEIGRFITIDDLSYLDSDTINGLNLYAYCGDNPVMRTDSQGTNWWNNVVLDWWNDTKLEIGIWVDKNLVSPFNNWLANAWNWLNGIAWYQILVKKIVLSSLSTGLGALFGFIFGPVGSLAGTIIGAFAGIVVGVLWDFGVSGINP